MQDLKYWVALSTIPQLGAARIRLLESYFGEMGLAWRADSKDLQQARLDSRTVLEVLEGRKRIDPDDSMSSLIQGGIKATNWNMDDYPPRLKHIFDPPPVLYYKGEIQPEDEWSVAVVGTRRPTDYGKRAATKLSRDLASSGITVVSGLALGIDGIAHRAALDCGGRTIAVVAGGLDSVYPREHTGLFRQIEDRGAVVTEHALGVRPDGRNFPRRNRLISGMALGTLVVEAPFNSGTRSTVEQALAQDREVFCIPGEIFSENSKLTNQLIKAGAKLVADYTDILEELNLPSTLGQSGAKGVAFTEPDVASTKSAEDIEELELDEGEAALVARLSGEPMHVDDLCRDSGLPIASIMSMLTLLEFKGIVIQAGSMHYVKASTPEVTHGS